MTAYVVLVLAVGVERLVELVVAKRNLAWAMARGGRETGFAHYPVMVVLHTGLLVGALVEVLGWHRSIQAGLAVPMVVLVLLAQALRWWCIRTLGRQWNTRVVVVPGLALIAGGPYRYLRHPNYVAVVVEGVALPLAGSAWVTAVVFTVANAALLWVRLRTEERALHSVAGSAVGA